MCAHTCAIMMHFYIIDHSSSDSGDVSHTMSDNIKFVDLPGCAVCARAHVCCVCFKTNHFQAKRVTKSRKSLGASHVLICQSKCHNK